MKKITDGLYYFYKIVVYVFFMLIMLWLGVMAIFSTSYISGDYYEKTYYISDSPVLNILFVILTLLILLLAIKLNILKRADDYFESNPSAFIQFKRIITLITIGMGLFWVLGTQGGTGEDQYYVMQAAYALRRHDYALFEKGAYVSIYPNQIGLIVILYAASFIFGNLNNIVLQIFNVLAVGIIINVLSLIVKKMRMGIKSQLAVMILGILYLPLTFYSNFVYGTTMGLAAGLLAILFEISYFEKKKIIDAVFAGLLIGFSVMCKSNYLIFFVGMIIFAIMECIKKRKIQLIIIIMCLVTGYLLQSILPKMYIEHKTGCDLSKGAATLSWVAMGLSDTSWYAEGWYNGYNKNSYLNNNCDPKLQTEDAKAQIRQTLKKWKDDKSKAYKFFAKKTASQWNNPTFQSLWITQAVGGNVEAGPVQSYILSVHGSNRIAWYLNFLQIIILFGAILSMFVKFSSRRNDISTLMYMIFVGGFVFHLFWEAKAQYTFPYYVLLLPLAISGYSWFLRKSTGCINYISNNGFSLNLSILLPLIKMVCGLIVIFSLVNIKPVKQLIFVENNNEEYEEYLETRDIKRVLKDGKYKVSPASKPESFLSVIGLSDGKAEVTFSDMETAVYITMFQTETKLEFYVSHLYLNSGSYSDNGAYEVNAEKSSNSSSQEWHLVKNADNTFTILSGYNNALTFTGDGKVCVTAYNKDDINQKWKIETIN